MVARKVDARRRHQCGQLFASEGVTVVRCGRRLAPPEENLAKLKAGGGRGLVLSADLSKVEDANRVVEETITTYGRVDVLVHCASVGWSWSHQSPNSMNVVATTPPGK